MRATLRGAPCSFLGVVDPCQLAGPPGMGSPFPAAASTLPSCTRISLPNLCDAFLTSTPRALWGSGRTHERDSEGFLKYRESRRERSMESFCPPFICSPPAVTSWDGIAAVIGQRHRARAHPESVVSPARVCGFTQFLKCLIACAAQGEPVCSLHLIPDGSASASRSDQKYIHTVTQQ